mgnify:CR=1 FL=1
MINFHGLLQMVLHVCVALALVSGMEDAPYHWEFWAVMLDLPVIRMVDAWYRP